MSEPGSSRYASVDLARGLALALIAVANVIHWQSPAGSSPGPVRPLLEGASPLLVSTLMAQWAYPLFALLLGFGMASIVERDGVHGLRRRALGLLVIGAFHALIFPSDILGTYALASALLAPWLAAGHRLARRVLLVFVLSTSSAVLLVAGMVASSASGPPAPGWPSWQGAVDNLGYWAGNSVLGVPGSLVVPSALGGAWLFRSGLLDRAERQHVSAARSSALLLVVGVTGSTSWALASWHWGSVPSWALAAHALTALAGAVGWLGLLVAPRRTGALMTSRPVLMLVATGRRSLSAYLAQSVGFLVLFAALGPLGPVQGTGLALVIWAGTVRLCWWAQLRGSSGPLELLLRLLTNDLSPGARRRGLRPVPSARLRQWLCRGEGPKG